MMERGTGARTAPFSLYSPDGGRGDGRGPDPQQGDKEAVKVVAAGFLFLFLVTPAACRVVARGGPAAAALLLAAATRHRLALGRRDVALADQGDQVAAVLEQDGG